MSQRETPTVKALEADMIAAAILDGVGPIYDELYARFGPACEQAELLAMVVYIGRTLAKHPGIREDDRGAQLDSAINMIRRTFEQYRRR